MSEGGRLWHWTLVKITRGGHCRHPKGTFFGTEQEVRDFIDRKYTIIVDRNGGQITEWWYWLDGERPSYEEASA